MPPLADEIAKTGRFDSEEQEAFLNLWRSCDVLMHEVEQVLDGAEVSAAQYNALRILRGAGGEGLPCGEVARRMITREPDITRLLDRLEARGLVARRRSTRDRRVVLTGITPAGAALLDALDPRVHATHRRQLGHLGPRPLRQLIRLLELARRRPPPSTA